MAKAGSGQPILVALGLKDDEITRVLTAASEAIAELRRRLPEFSAADISAWAGNFRTIAESLQLVTGMRRNLLARANIASSDALKQAVANLAPDVRPTIEEAEKRVKSAASILRKELRSLGYFARLHISHLEGILSTIGEAAGFRATYRPGRQVIGGNLGIVDATA